ncbi:NAD(P)H-binding protein [Flavobacterium marginilacus]|uniref:NAD(P)H-binding protein n=1 Tax=Flavobacterium marginilacus TaxID=3003256 RepID=UPI00248E224E|nr:NAD(P)H-binding protein [Flavobacterium marginilacus]
MSNSILVLGSTGKTGKRVAERLQNLQLPIRLGSRNGQPSFNWDEPSNWHEVLTGIQSVYITFQPDLAVPQSIEKIKQFTEIAKQHNVKQLVLLSGRGEKEAEACEQIVIQSGLNWTIIRASWFMQNFSENFLLDSILSNKVVLPTIKALEPFVDADDIADVAVAALTDSKHSNKIYELTGTDLLSFQSTTNQIATALNKPIAYQEIEMYDYVAALQSYQLPEDFIWLVQYLFTEVLDGRNESLSNDIETVLGRKPTSFHEYISKTLKTGIWKVQ